MIEHERHAEILTELGAVPSEIAEILAYNARSFGDPILPADSSHLSDPPFIETWQDYCHAAKINGSFNVLQNQLVQFGFPIQNGISQTQAYRTATLQGVPVAQWNKGNILSLTSPEKLELSIYQTAAGPIPVLLSKKRHDFIILVQALAHRNEAVKIPDSMGACMVKGYNNWGRIFAYKKQWQKENPAKCSEAEWAEEFKKIISRKELYQDTFLILNDGNYSGVSAQDMDLSDQTWKDLSLNIRREHEATHYFTQRFFGSARNHVLDECIADYMGIVEANGCYRSDWFLRFMGLENYPHYREGGRLQNYVLETAMSAGAFKVLQAVVKKVAHNLEEFDRNIGGQKMKSHTIMKLCKLSLLDMVFKESFE